MSKKIKNAVWILTDSQHHKAAGYMGCDAVKTPNLDKLAESSRIFTNAFCQAPVCVPSRESFITGRYCSDVGILHNKHEHASDAETLGHLFRKAGYKTCFSGKSHFIADNLKFADHDMKRGFDKYADWDDYLQYLRCTDFFSKFDKSKIPAFCHEGDPSQHAFIEGAVNRAVNHFASQHDGHLEDHYTQEYYAYKCASEWLDQNHKDPFFLFLSLYRPHAPLFVPEHVSGPEIKDLPDLPWDDTDLKTTTSLRQRLAYLNDSGGNVYSPNVDTANEYAHNPELSENAKRSAEQNSYDPFRLSYFKSINYIDEYVGEILDKLDKLGHREDTMIIFTSDHGDMLGEHGLNLKMCFYDASIKVPLLVRIPGTWDQGERDNRPVMLLDLAPTLCNIFNIQNDNAFSEMDLINQSWDQTRPVFSEIVSAFNAEIAQYGFETHTRMVCSGNWKYLHKSEGPQELFDKENDPLENNNLGEDPKYQHICVKMKQMIDDHLGRYPVKNKKVVLQ